MLYILKMFLVLIILILLPYFIELGNIIDFHALTKDIILPIIAIGGALYGASKIPTQVHRFSKIQAIKDFETTSKWRENLMLVASFVDSNDCSNNNMSQKRAISVLRASILYVIPKEEGETSVPFYTKKKYEFYREVEKLYKRIILNINIDEEDRNNDSEKIRTYARMLLKVNWEYNQKQIINADDYMERHQMNNLHDQLMAKYYCNTKEYIDTLDDNN